MSRGVVLWFGPVTAANLAGALPAGWRLLVHNRGEGGGIGSSALALGPTDKAPMHFRSWASTLGFDPLTALGVGPDEPCVMAAFSAGHGATEEILVRVLARLDRRLVGVMGFDAYYTSYVKTPKPGHFGWLSWLQTAPDGRFATFTTSSTPGPNHPSGSASFRPLANALNMRSASDFPPFGRRPDSGYHAGPIRWWDYGAQYKHVEHATVLAKQFVRAALSPAQSSPTNPPTRTGGGLPILSLALFAARAFGDK